MLAAADQLANSKNRQIQCTRERRGLILYLAAASGMRPKEYLAVADAAVRDQGVNATRAVERNGDKHLHILVSVRHLREEVTSRGRITPKQFYPNPLT